jgi:hypothetical protein
VAVTATATCGHRRSLRVPTPWTLQDVTEPTAEHLAILDEHRRQVAARMENGTCETCVAEGSLSGIRSAIDRLAGVVDRPALPHLVGTPRQLAFAEGVRADRLWRIVNDRLMAVREPLRYPVTADRMVALALQTAWPTHHWPDPQDAVQGDLAELGRQMAAATSMKFGPRAMQGYGGMSGAEWLAAWLLLREEWNTDLVVMDDGRPRAWIARARRNRTFAGVPDVARYAVDAAVLVARIGGWRDRWDADAVFAMLIRDKSTLEQALAHPEGGSLHERMLNAAVMDALIAG